MSTVLGRVQVFSQLRLVAVNLVYLRDVYYKVPGSPHAIYLPKNPSDAHKKQGPPAQGDFQPNTSDPKVSGHRILVSADEGVFLAELEDMPAVP